MTETAGRERQCRNQQTTPEASQLVTHKEDITITDPRHPLYGRTFTLLPADETQHQDTWCVFELSPGIRQRTSVHVTDRSDRPASIFPSPLSWHSVRQLLADYAVITAEPVEGTKDENGQGNSDGKQAGPPAGGAAAEHLSGAVVGDADRAATAESVPDAGADMSATAAGGAQR